MDGQAVRRKEKAASGIPVVRRKGGNKPKLPCWTGEWDASHLAKNELGGLASYEAAAFGGIN